MVWPCLPSLPDLPENQTWQVDNYVQDKSQKTCWRRSYTFPVRNDGQRVFLRVWYDHHASIVSWTRRLCWSRWHKACCQVGTNIRWRLTDTCLDRASRSERWETPGRSCLCVLMHARVWVSMHPHCMWRMGVSYSVSANLSSLPPRWPLTFVSFWWFWWFWWFCWFWWFWWCWRPFLVFFWRFFVFYFRQRLPAFFLSGSWGLGNVFVRNGMWTDCELYVVCMWFTCEL